jgi:hypothetical protein
VSAQIVGSGEACWTDDRQKRFGADFLILGVMATAARQLTLMGGWGFELQ